MCTAVQIALVDLLRSWNVEATAVTGHSSGEIASAYSAGFLSHKSALCVSYKRGLIVSNLRKDSRTKKGAMLAVGMSEVQLTPLLHTLQSGKAIIACYNSPDSLTISGDESAVMELQELLNTKKIFNRKLAVDVAYHSDHMVSAEKQYLQAIQDITIEQAANVDFYSSVTSFRLDGHGLGAQYWVDNLLNPVNFSGSLKNLCLGVNSTNKSIKRSSAIEPGIDIVIEVGPHSALGTYFKQIVKSEPKLSNSALTYIPTLIRGKDASITMHAVASQLFERGYPIDINAVNNLDFTSKPQVITDLPPYPWNHSKSYWAEPFLSKRYRHRQQPRNDLLGVQIQPYNPTEPQWRNLIRPSEIPWIRDHKVDGSIIYPAAGFLAMAIEAAKSKTESTQRGALIKSYELRQVVIGAALVITETNDTLDGAEVFFSLRPYNENCRRSSDIWDEFRVFSSSADQTFMEHCRGLISVKTKNVKSSIPSAKETIQRQATMENMLSENLNPSKMYEQLRGIGLDYGSTFANVARIRYGASKACVQVSIPDTASVMPAHFEYPHIIHPALLDACFHAMFPAMISEKGFPEQLALPTFIESVTVAHGVAQAPETELDVYAEYTKSNHNQSTYSIMVCDKSIADSRPCIVIEGFTTTMMSNKTNQNEKSTQKKLCFIDHWSIDPEMLSSEEVTNTCSTESPAGETEKVKIFEEAVFYLIEKALRQISLQEVSGLLPHHQKLYSTLSQFKDLVYGKQMDYPTESWLVTSEAEKLAVIDRMEKSGDEGRLLAHVGKNLVRIFRQEVDPLSVMLEQDRLAKYYQNTIRMTMQYDQTARYIDLLAHKNPDIKILEIGAGTGGEFPYGDWYQISRKLMKFSRCFFSCFASPWRSQ